MSEVWNDHANAWKNMKKASQEQTSNDAITLPTICTNRKIYVSIVHVCDGGVVGNALQDY